MFQQLSESVLQCQSPFKVGDESWRFECEDMLAILRLNGCYNSITEFDCIIQLRTGLDDQWVAQYISETESCTYTEIAQTISTG